MAQVGGYRPTAPQNNFAVSATGGAGNGGQAPKYVAGMPYGEGADFMDLQSMAPMEASAGGPSASSVGTAPSQLAQQRPNGGPSQFDINLVPLDAPSQRPHEPVTTGIDAGAGPGSDVLRLNNSPDVVEDDAAKARIASYRPVLMYMASRPETSPETRMFIRQLIGE